jgi:DNA polymerase V
MMAMDRLNRRDGRGALALADTEQRSIERAWETKAERRTPRYTTRWNELPLART